MTRLKAAIDRLTDWYLSAALPLWAGNAADPSGLFYESLDFSGAPVIGQQRRVRVQSRQIYVFTHAALNGWLPEGEAIAARGFRRLIETACPDRAARGCVHLIDDAGAVVDHKRDLYDQAFLLLACSARINAVNDPVARGLADRTLAFLDRELISAHGGYRENDKGDLPRRQNPHMHLFEALMALYEATRDKRYLARARAIEELFQQRFFDRKHVVVREFFNDDWSLIDGVSDRLEPGHMMEWVYLLDWFDRTTGENRTQYTRQLYMSGRSRRIDATPFLPNEALRRQAIKSGRRLWPQTEHLRAAIVLARDGATEMATDAADLIDALFSTYFNQPTPGLWCDEYDAAGRCIAQDVPASILYHLHEAVSSAAECRHRLAP